MLSIFLCGFIAIACFVAARRSLVTGIGATLAVGYIYGIARANIAQTGSHFLFDAAVVGLFLARLTKSSSDTELPVPRQLIFWVVILIAWPFFLMAIPQQDPLVQLVGFRGNAFLLPYILLGSQLDDERRNQLALWCAALNIFAFAFAAAEFQLGLPAFFPRNAVTTIIYASNDVAGNGNYRIPAVFGSAHAYGGTMVMTLPLILGAWLNPRKGTATSILLATAILAASVGVFMSAARSHALLLFAFLGFATVSARMSLLARAGWISLMLTIAILVAADARLQRFTTLSDSGYVTERIGWSVNSSFLDLAVKYPLGNGLASGGTSVPFFLSGRMQSGERLENEYGRIMVEQGVPGLLIWLSFIGWTLLRPSSEATRAWRNARTLAWCVTCVSFASALIGTGLLTSVPQTALFLISLGWLASGRNARAATQPARASNARFGQLPMHGT